MLIGKNFGMKINKAWREKSPGSQARIDGKDGWRLLALGDRLMDGKPAMQLISGDSRSI